MSFFSLVLCSREGPSIFDVGTQTDDLDNIEDVRVVRVWQPAVVKKTFAAQNDEEDPFGSFYATQLEHAARSTTSAACSMVGLENPQLGSSLAEMSSQNLEDGGASSSAHTFLGASNVNNSKFSRSRKPQNPEMDVVDHFSMLVKPYLMKLPAENKLRCMKEIMEVINKHLH
ncbi:hypothetical protein GDO81_014666 [Engystomops pustulosus]|uniref:BESS domain-containing protein n=1 Tax=Engystomops pustulosus TaxID=76066 RepID=A0AAV7BC93_ENGPU|nr:hypothetical protein GDO81_014666 [Engystomops pustulosus]